MPARNAVPVATDDSAHDQAEQVRRAPHEPHNTIVVAGLCGSDGKFHWQVSKVFELALYARYAHADVDCCESSHEPPERRDDEQCDLIVPDSQCFFPYASAL